MRPRLNAAPTPVFRRRWVRFFSLVVFMMGASAVVAPSRVFSQLPTAREWVDEIGRRVRLPASVQRVVSMAPSLTTILFALGLDREIVGVTNYCEFPAAAKSKPKIGGIINPSIEKIVSLKPDLVVATTEANRRVDVETLARLGVPVYVAKPRNLEGVYQTIQHLAEIVSRVEAGQQLVHELRARQQRVEQTVAGRRRPRVFVMFAQRPIISAGRDAFPTDLVRRAGGESITAQLAQDWPRLSLEFVLQRDPEILILPHTGGGNAQMIEQLKTSPGWKNLTAVRTNKIFFIDDSLNQPGPRLLDALEQLARIIHPEVF